MSTKTQSHNAMIVADVMQSDDDIFGPHNCRDVHGRIMSHRDVGQGLESFIDDVVATIDDIHVDDIFINKAASIIDTAWRLWFDIDSIYYSPMGQFDPDFSIDNKDSIVINPSLYYGRQYELIALGLKHHNDANSVELYEAIRGGFMYIHTHRQLKKK